MYELEYKPPLTGSEKFLLFAGVIMPAISITVEATTHICAMEFFDPIPSLWHLLLVVFVPIAQLHVWFAVRRGTSLRLAGWLNALALGISLFYSFVYIPLLPLAALTLLFIIGVLPLAPLLSLVAAIVMRHQLRQVAKRARQNNFILRTAGLLAGLVIIAALIGLLELPASVTRYGLKMAASGFADSRARGIQFLRTFGSKEYLLRACYGRSGSATDLFGYFFTVQDPVTTVQAQEIYYRVTGETFDTSLPPRRVGSRLLPQEEFDFDNDQGGVKIGGKLKRLLLANSRIDGSADADGGVAYLQWTLHFLNQSQQQREARAEVQLPPGAVVSRLTLWVNGEEREAAFAGTAKVREAYQQVAIRQRRDPVLVTTAGRDRILVQCFPVPPNGGQMKIRIGITVPLVLQDTNNVRLLLPHFINRNFSLPDNLDHSLWIESKTVMTPQNNAFMTSLFSEQGFVFVSGGAIPDRELSKPETSITLSRANLPVWTKDPFQTGNFIIQQSVEARAPDHLYRIVLVVDTSQSMENRVHEISQALRSLPPQFDLKLVLADADGRAENVTASGVEEALAKLRSAVFLGGADNAPALVKAWDLAAETPGNNVIVWVHDPQRLQLESVEHLRHRWERSPYGPTLYSVRVTSGSDEVEKRLDGINEVKSVARIGSLESDLTRLFERLTGKAMTLEWVRTSQKVDHNPDPSVAFKASDHLARLWANDEVTRILKARDESLREAATMLAVRYQLVTPVSGAVVLETDQQYRATGLTPVDAGTVPTIPEPEMVALLAVVGVFLMWLMYRKRRATGIV